MKHYESLRISNCAGQHRGASQDLKTIAGFADRISEGVDVRDNIIQIRDLLPRLRSRNDNTGIFSCVLVY